MYNLTEHVPFCIRTMATANIGDETEEVLVSDDSQATLQFDCLIGHIENIILSKFFFLLIVYCYTQTLGLFIQEQTCSLNMPIFLAVEPQQTLTEWCGIRLWVFSSRT